MIQALKFFFEGCGLKRSRRSTGRMKFQLQVTSNDQRRDLSMTIKQDRVPCKILNRNITHAQWFLFSDHLLLILCIAETRILVRVRASQVKSSKRAIRKPIARNQTRIAQTTPGIRPVSTSLRGSRPSLKTNIPNSGFSPPDAAASRLTFRFPSESAEKTIPCSPRTMKPSAVFTPSESWN